MGKFDKRETCEYCEEKMNSKYRNKRFCSARCRVYWNRESKIITQPIIPKDDLKKELSSWEKMRNKRLGISK